MEPNINLTTEQRRRMVMELGVSRADISNYEHDQHEKIGKERLSRINDWLTKHRIGDRPSKHKQVEQHLLSGKTLTGAQAYELYRVYRLAPIIGRLRAKGWNITDDNNGHPYSKYRLSQAAQEVL